jgi:hypothetical protein
MEKRMDKKFADMEKRMNEKSVAFMGFSLFSALISQVLPIKIYLDKKK